VISVQEFSGQSQLARLVSVQVISIQSQFTVEAVSNKRCTR